MLDDDFDTWCDLDDDDDESGEPVGSCDECDCNLYVDDCYSFRGLEVCGQCLWRMKCGLG